MAQPAILLVNLGSPASPSVADVRRYLAEFLGDKRVLDAPVQPLRWLLLHGLILRTRPKRSARAYESIWTAEGAPLIAVSRRVRDLLRARLPAPVELAMRYGEPSIAGAVGRLAAAGVDRLLLFPQYPHYALSTWETVVIKVREETARRAPQMHVDCVQPFYGDADYLAALVASARPWLDQPHDHLLFSYHGIPVRHLRKADPTRSHCTLARDCCAVASPAQSTCYKAQVTHTAREFSRRAGCDPAHWSIAFQSRLVGEPWLSPYTDVEIVRLAQAGVKRLAVITPAFVTDCLETLEEIRIRGDAAFRAAGGERFTHIPCLNDHPAWMDFLAARASRWLSTGLASPE